MQVFDCTTPPKIEVADAITQLAEAIYRLDDAILILAMRDSA